MNTEKMSLSKFKKLYLDFIYKNYYKHNLDFQLNIFKWDQFKGGHAKWKQVSESYAIVDSHFDYDTCFTKTIVRLALLYVT